jgi:TolB-like protein/Flp pilus assembly protein TadD
MCRLIPLFAVLLSSGQRQGYNRLTLSATRWTAPEAAVGEPSLNIPPLERPPEKRLDSWKEIAAYLNRDVTTVQRWEKREGMPVHRHVHAKRGSVYALSTELDAWRESRKRLLGEEVERPYTAVSAGEESRLEQTPARSPLRSYILAASAVLCIVAALYLFSRGRAQHTAMRQIRAIAVLPLKNLTGNPAQEYLADGMTEALIGRLSNIHGLRVISRTSVMRFKNSQVPVPEIAKTLGVDALVEGSVMREGNRIRVTVQLIRGASDDHFWSETYDGELQDVFRLQSDLAQAIAAKVEVTVTGEERERIAAARTVAPGVYESYSKGQFALNKGNSRADVDESIADFQDAIQKDPNFAPAYLGIANAYTALGTVFMSESPGETRPKAMAAVKRALNLDPNLSEAHVLLANLKQQEWHWVEAESEYRRALELNPNSISAAEGYALWLACNGRSDEALNWAERGRELDPLSAPGGLISAPGGLTAWILFQTRRYDMASRDLHAALALRPDDASALLGLGFVLTAENKPAEAIPPLEKAAVLSNRSPAVLGVLTRAYARAGRRRDALRVLAELKTRRQKGYVPAGAFVNAYLGLGNKDQAFYWLEQAYREQSNILQFVKSHPYFDSIRSDRRFADLVRRVGLS